MRRLKVVVGFGVKTGICVTVRSGMGGRGRSEGDVGESEEVRRLDIKRRWSSFSSSSSSDGASKASFKSLSSWLCRALSSRECRRELLCDRKEGGGELGMTSSVSLAETCEIACQYPFVTICYAGRHGEGWCGGR